MSLNKKYFLFAGCGRSGTEWFGKTLKNVYGDIIEVNNEGNLAFEFINQYSDPQIYYNKKLDPTKEGKIIDHLEKVKELNKNYVEIFWESYAFLPFVIDFLGRENVKIVNLIRHPARVVVSNITHDVFCPVGNFSWGRTPNEFLFFENNRRHGQTAFEAGIIFWCELNKYVRFISNTFGIPLKTIKFEDIILKKDKNIIEDFLNFIDVPFKDEFVNQTNNRIDSNYYGIRQWEKVGYKQILDQKIIDEIARYGYSMSEFSEEQLIKIYER